MPKRHKYCTGLPFLYCSSSLLKNLVVENLSSEAFVSCLIVYITGIGNRRVHKRSSTMVVKGSEQFVAPFPLETNHERKNNPENIRKPYWCSQMTVSLLIETFFGEASMQKAF